jgi:hypothetical protein
MLQKRIFWLCLLVLPLIADSILGFWWGLLAAIPLVFLSWWIAYRSGWFD